MLTLEDLEGRFMVEEDCRCVYQPSRASLCVLVYQAVVANLAQRIVSFRTLPSAETIQIMLASRALAETLRGQTLATSVKINGEILISKVPYD